MVSRGRYVALSSLLSHHIGMCGRITDHHSWNELVELYRLTLQPALNLKARYNVAPTQQINVVHDLEDDSSHHLTRMRWGLVPFWAKDIKIGQKMINARSETVAEKPAFRNALKHRRCLIPASGFFEWKREKDKKQPWYISRADVDPLTFAGLYERWKSPEGEEVLSCSIITCGPNAVMEPIHNRMPVVLNSTDFDQWLETPDLELLKPCPDEWLQLWEVRKEVGNVRNDGVENIEKI